MRAAVLACCAAAGLAGCAAGTPGSQSTVLPDRTVSAPASTAATGDPQVLARQAYLGMWQAFFTASRTADYQSPSLAHYAAGSALELLIHGLYQYHREGIVTRGTPSHDLAVTMTKTSLGTPEAKVTDCSDILGQRHVLQVRQARCGRSHRGGRRSTRRCSRSTAPGR